MAAMISIEVTGNTLAYCSSQLGGCALYRTEAFRNPQRVRNVEIPRNQDDLNALAHFSGSAHPAPVPAVPTLGKEGLTGALQPRGGARWKTVIHLSSRGEIVASYRTFRKEGVEDLTRWLRATIEPASGYRTITIPCFSPQDPFIQLYGERSNEDPVVISVFRDKEMETWTEAARIEGVASRPIIEHLRRVVDEITCATVTFQGATRRLQ